MLPLQVEIVCCAYYHLLAQQIFMLQKVDVAFTFYPVKRCSNEHIIFLIHGALGNKLSYRYIVTNLSFLNIVINPSFLTLYASA